MGNEPLNGPQPTIHILHHTLRRGGGMEQYALTLGWAFKGLGHRVVFHPHATDEAIAAQLGVDVRPLRIGRFPRKLQDFRYFRALGADRLEGGIQIALSRVRARDLVICGGTHLGYLQRARKIAGPFDWLQTWMERQAYGAARVVIAHSDLCRQELLQLYAVPERKILTIYPSIDCRFRPAVDELERSRDRQRLGLPADKRVLLFPSMGHRRKGLKPICEALEHFSHAVVLAVAGKTGGSQEGTFIRQLGYVEDMAPLYRAADFTVLGSYYEPFGLVGPESILSGTRLIFEQNIGCLTAIKPEAVLTFSVLDLDSIRAAVGRALQLAAKNQHRLGDPKMMLRYDPDPVEHARALLRAAAVPPSAAANTGLSGAGT